MDGVLGEAYVIIGSVVSKAAYVEQQMNSFIAHHYLSDGESEAQLVEEVFEQERFSFDAKRNIMCLIVEKHYKEHSFPNGQLIQLQKIRNTFAHGRLVSEPDPENPEEGTKVAKIRHGAENKSIKALNEEFSGLYMKILAEFDKLPNLEKAQELEITSIG